MSRPKNIVTPITIAVADIHLNENVRLLTFNHPVSVSELLEYMNKHELRPPTLNELSQADAWLKGPLDEWKPADPFVVVRKR